MGTFQLNSTKIGKNKIFNLQNMYKQNTEGFDLMIGKRKLI